MGKKLNTASALTSPLFISIQHIGSVPSIGIGMQAELFSTLGFSNEQGVFPLGHAPQGLLTFGGCAKGLAHSIPLQCGHQL